MTNTTTKVKITLTKTLENGKWVIRISGLSSGLEVVPMDCDNIMITCRFDASRFEPVFKNN